KHRIIAKGRRQAFRLPLHLRVPRSVKRGRNFFPGWGCARICASFDSQNKCGEESALILSLFAKLSNGTIEAIALEGRRVPANIVGELGQQGAVGKSESAFEIPR